MARKKQSKYISKERVKTMSKNGKRHFFRNLRRIFKYGLIGFGRNIWLSVTATLVMTFTLFLLFVTIIASVVLSSTADTMREKIDITIFFKPGTSQSELKSMKKIMSKDSNVKEVTVADSKQEYAKFLSETKSNSDQELLSALDDKEMEKLMLESMQATMRVKVVDANDLSSVKRIVSDNRKFKKNIDTEKKPTYNTNDTAIDTIVSWSNIAKTGGLALSALFLLISVLVIFNTIRMAIYSRSEEIYMEKLVGADDTFVRGPFLVEAMISGIAAGILSGGLGYLTFKLLSPRLVDYDIDITEIANILNSSWLIVVLLSMILLGSIIGLISSRLAVHKYLKST